jgi:molybdopterin-guanine dinucleotide biosynthesis protein A
VVQVGGIILCGGKSQRMGRSKAMLPFGAEPMLARVVRILSEAVTPIVVVAAPQQALPELSAGVEVVRDRAEGRGPLEGLYCGLAALRPHVTAAYVTACDVPLLRVEFVRRLIDQLGDHDVVVPQEGKFHHPLAAVYRTELVDAIAACLARDQLRMISFYDQVKTRRVAVQELAAVDPPLDSLMNLNSRGDYQAALRKAGLRGENG